MREYSLTLGDYCAFICLDDKHKVQTGEQGFPVASAEIGRRVPTREDEYLTVSDHHFTKFSLVPSVVFFGDIPQQIPDSWYLGT
jgi:hypothetical protein